MDTYELILSRRSVRRFRPDPVSDEALRRMVDAARLAPSAANLQPLRYLVVTDGELRAKVFETLRWAAYIAPAGNPPPGCEPTAYVIVIHDERVRSKQYQYDVGFAAENLLIAGLGDGVAGCAMLSFDPKHIRRTFSLPDHLNPVLVVALGYPDEDPAAVDRSDTIRYWRDESGRHYVPKISLDEASSFNELGDGWL